MDRAKERDDFGERWRVVDMLDEFTVKTTEVQMVRRWPDGREELRGTMLETVAEEFKTAEEAIERAVERCKRGELVKVDHMPDGRGGYTGGHQTVVAPSVLSCIIRYARL